MSESPDEERLGELINEFFDRRNRGETVSEEEFLASHPEDAAVLREHLGGLHMIAALGSTVGHRTAPAGHALHMGGSSGEDQLAGASVPPPAVEGYEIFRQIGRGGMGVVFKAMQCSTKRLVALKLLLEGPLASESARRRFEREIALAAQLNHNNIIPIYDSGVTEGRMYYAMEYIHGAALGDYLRQNNLDIPARLQLFVKICNAVRHAHQRGVVHRDLKPTNVLVDGENEPHVLDFGLAKATVLLDTTTSVSAQLVGTPAYMSPEQAAGDPTAIDTRTDVYSLGVVLYEMLTGRMPYDTHSSIGKVLQNVAHAEPTPPDRYDDRIDDELSAIVLKALEKAKESRYQSVDALSSDVLRYLAGEPVTAKRASAFYLFRKAIRSNRLAASFVALVVLFAGTTWGLARYYSRKFEHTQQQVRRLETQVAAQQGDPTGRPPGLAADSRLSDTDASRRELEWILKNADPELVKMLQPVVRELSKSVESGEDARLAMARLLVTAMAEGAEPEPELTKSQPQYDLTSPEISPRPGTTSAEPASPGPRLDARKVERILRLLQQSIAAQPASDASSTSQAATSGPSGPDTAKGEDAVAPQG